MEFLLGDFIYYNQFKEDLSDLDITQVIDYILIAYHGVTTLWALYPEPLRTRIRKQVLSDLVAWQLVNTNPSLATTASNGPIPLTRKSIDNITLAFKNLGMQETALQNLLTNVYGIQALSKLQSAPEIFLLY